jgi:hypothetical protein
MLLKPWRDSSQASVGTRDSGWSFCFKCWDTIILQESEFWYDIANLSDVEIDKASVGSKIVRSVGYFQLPARLPGVSAKGTN